MFAQLDHGRLMDRVYRHQRHFYDATRKYYLLGRDPMIAGLAPPPGATILEIGCGTGRNLVLAGRAYPQTRLYGVDISSEMLATARRKIAQAGLEQRATLAYADAARFAPAELFDVEKFDRIFISYAVSMIPQWRDVVEEAVSHLSPSGSLHIVDFGDLRDLPTIARQALYTWLGWYHVSPRNDLFEVARSVASKHGCTLGEQRLYRGFAWIAVLRRLQQQDKQ
ncbi:class I SAM-dependent methyltransferase [Phyllobacterium sp. 0TCS1.6C]|uniref:class I SAM-dependent methyltransferase n=1 Tax=unclassified Phyllobacterium TaxID=2638441 RepID=UPI0022640BE4|nr:MULTISPECIES: class I SAM-dependent methyltransferase [unclassified Phyllobacterium]MCX8279622.1 class I SAM-dependent methyltransferase [Phyllobacterium sp. 0TCS1.6C]MCX8292187.1 class I SAM-dependent methyltransferase [Phyllobacterium sp. 0TCS1.6A]